MFLNSFVSIFVPAATLIYGGPNFTPRRHAKPSVAHRRQSIKRRIISRK